jgi:uncharacterized protein (TIGR03437 family)
MTGVPLGDTWIWDGTNWTQARPSVSPPARMFHTMTYDAARQQSVIFSGVGVDNNAGDVRGNASQGVTLSDTWVWGLPGTNPVDQPPGPLIGSVVNGASFLAGIQNNSWITIRGTNLSATTRDANGAIVNGMLPASLDGVSVRVNGKAAVVYYISPTQVNALAPADSALGMVPVNVTNAHGTSPAFAAQMQQYSPSFFVFDRQGGRYAAATFADGGYVGAPGLFGTAVETRPARPGEFVSLWGTGFGLTNPPVPADRVVSGAAPLAGSVNITIGGLPTTVQFAGMSGAGLCQFNIVTPELPDGDHKVAAIIGGVQSQDNVYMSVRR